MLSTPAAVIAGLTYDALPFMALPIYVALENIDRSLRRGGGRPLREPASSSFLRVILPLSAPGVYAGILLVAITNIGDYVSAAILGGPEHDDDRQHHPDPVRAERELPGGVGARADPDGGAARRDVRVRARLRHSHRSRSTCEAAAGDRRSGLAPTRGTAPLARFVLPGYVGAGDRSTRCPDRGDGPLRLQPGAARDA